MTTAEADVTVQGEAVWWAIAAGFSLLTAASIYFKSEAARLLAGVLLALTIVAFALGTPVAVRSVIGEEHDRGGVSSEFRRGAFAARDRIAGGSRYTVLAALCLGVLAVWPRSNTRR